MFDFFTYWLEPTACFLYLLTVVFYLRRSGKTTKNSLVVYYVTVTLLLLLACVFSTYKLGQTIWLYELAGLSTALLLAVYFHSLLQSPFKKRVVQTLALVYVVYAIARNLTLTGPRLFDSIGYSLASASVVVYVFMYFHQVLKNVSESSIFSEFNFWLSSGYLVYYFGSFIIFLTYFYFTKKLFENYTEEGKQLLMTLWGLHNVLLFLGATSLLFGSLWIAYRKKST